MVTSYEVLRRVALGHRTATDGPSLGFTLVLRQGMTAWLQAWAASPSPAIAKPAAAVPLTAMPSVVHHELAQVWAQIVLLHQEALWS